MCGSALTHNTFAHLHISTQKKKKISLFYTLYMEYGEEGYLVRVKTVSWRRGKKKGAHNKIVGVQKKITLNDGHTMNVCVI
jgi:hypothetical protein